MYVSSLASHQVQPLLSQLLTQDGGIQRAFQVTHLGQPAYVILSWPLFTRLRTVLVDSGYEDQDYLRMAHIGIARMAKSFLSIENVRSLFAETAEGPVRVVCVLKRNRPVGVVIQHAYYETLLTFLQEHQAPHLEPFHIALPPSTQEQRVVSLTTFRNLALQLPHRFAEEQQAQGMSLPLLVQRYQEPVLVTMSWETFQRLMEGEASPSESFSVVRTWWQTLARDEKEKE